MLHEYKQQLLMKCEKATRWRGRDGREEDGEERGESEGEEVKVQEVMRRRERRRRWRVNREDVVWRRCLRISEGDGEAEGKNNQRLSAAAGTIHFDTAAAVTLFLSLISTWKHLSR